MADLEISKYRTIETIEVAAIKLTVTVFAVRNDY